MGAVPHLTQLMEELADEPVSLLIVTDEKVNKIGKFVETFLPIATR